MIYFLPLLIELAERYCTSGPIELGWPTYAVIFSVVFVVVFVGLTIADYPKGEPNA